MAENIREELDCEGEWFYDFETGMLSVIPYADMGNLQNLDVEVSLNTEIFRLKGKDTLNVVQNIQFAGFIIENTSRTMFTTRNEEKEYIPLLRGDWAVVRSGSIYLENTENVMIRDCVFRNIGGNGLFFWGYNADHHVYNNEFLHIGSTAIQIVGKVGAIQ